MRCLMRLQCLMRLRCFAGLMEFLMNKAQNLKGTLSDVFRGLATDKAPLSKSLLLVPSALSLLTLLLPHCQKFFVYDLHAVKSDFQLTDPSFIVVRLAPRPTVDAECRIFERRYGSRKFASFLLGSWVLSALFDLVLVEAVQYSFGIPVANNLPSGFDLRQSRLQSHRRLQKT
ncbi:hypothetical protein ACRRTK_019243 [Alexandromys fortis]